MKRSMRKALFIWITLIFVLTACQSSTSDYDPAEDKASSQELKKIQTEDQGQTITLNHTATSDTKQGAPAEKGYKIQTRLTDFQLLSASAGLAWGVTRNELRIYVTQDSGGTWDNVSPAQTVTFSEPPTYGKDIFFLNQNNGWVVRNASGVGETLILHTTDGGQNWNFATLDDEVNVLGIYFMDSKMGWALASSDSANSAEDQQEKVLYITKDGGNTWEKVMQNTGIYEAKGLATQAIPKFGKLVGMSFRDRDHGFVTLEQQGKPHLYMTSDSGKTWKSGPDFEKNTKMSNCHALTTGKPQFFGDSKTAGWMNIGCVTDNQTSYNGYFTNDAGKTWNFAPFALKAQTGVNQSMGPTFLNNKIGWSVVDGVVYRTTNQGKTWTALSVNNTLQRTLNNYPELAKLQFFSANVGWLLVAKNEERRSLLMQTTDGGKTWHVL